MFKLLKTGETWQKYNDDGRVLNCSCLGNGSGEWHCQHVDQCEHNGNLYYPKDTWGTGYKYF